MLTVGPLGGGSPKSHSSVKATLKKSLFSVDRVRQEKDHLNCLKMGRKMAEKDLKKEKVRLGRAEK